MTSTAAPTKATDQKRAKAYAAAERAIREKHAAEFADLYQAECVKAGIAFKPRLTAEQKAAKTIADLYEQFPNLRPEPMIDFPDQD